ncbi:MAG TPA: CvpA family protein [Piscinibacter sp.]|uniref:CvpA family protein n=1 Tax=Piscinibacter sp. TaxID=1903157 RepID=UPI002B9FFB94|nr:CvpA family protein [Piscinibacter sp.]
MDFAQIGWVDMLLLAVLAVSVIVGLIRGFVFEVLSLAGWIAAWFAAQWFAPVAAPYVPLGVPGSALNLGAAFAAVFVAALIVWAIAARLIRLLIQATPLSLPDRGLGAVFGALRGVVLLLAVAAVVGLTPAVRSAAWQQSHGAGVLAALLDGLMPLLPPQVASQLRRA